jgi:hypothetical protein
MARRQRHGDIAVGEERAEPHPRLDPTGGHVDALRAWVLFGEGAADLRALSMVMFMGVFLCCIDPRASLFSF